MTRGTRFRAWDTKAKEWADPAGAIDYIDPMPDGTFYLDPPKHIILMQFTGLRDRTGKEIYEGDLLDVDVGNRIAVVEWFPPQVAFDTKLVRCLETQYGLFRALVNNQWPYRCEVIGNIYENPELLHV